MLINCFNCNKEFNKAPSQIKLYKHHYCSTDCFNQKRPEKTHLNNKTNASNVNLVCSKCNKDKNICDFYKKNNNRVYSWCKSCINKDTINRQRKFKQQIVDYKGGKCHNCGYNKSINALEFHHIDPTKKEFSLSDLRLGSFDKNYNKIVKELDKCILVCANCHRETHEVLLPEIESV